MSLEFLIAAISFVRAIVEGRGGPTPRGRQSSCAYCAPTLESSKLFSTLRPTVAKYRERVNFPTRDALILRR